MSWSAADCVQHDLDATALGFELGQVPYTEHRILRADPRLVELALAAQGGRPSA